MTAEEGKSRFSARARRGPDLLETLGAALDDLHAATATPVTARRPWLQAWIESFPDRVPIGVVVRGTDGVLEAAALFAEVRRNGVRHIVGLGHGPSDQMRLPARSGDTADALAAAVASYLRALPGPWSLRMEQLPMDDPVARGIAARLPHASFVRGDGCPATRFDKGPEPKAYESRNSRAAAKKMRNRVQRDGLELQLERFRDPDRIAKELVEVERVHRDRDRDLVRKSDLDDPGMARFWRTVIVRLGRRGEVELVTLRLSGALAGYVVGLLDGRSYRMWDARFAPAFRQYSPGRLADQYAVQSALEDERFDEFDWMRGEEDYKLSSAGVVVPAQHLLAWSSGTARAVTEGPRALKAWLKGARDRNEMLGKLWLRFKARVVLRNRGG